MNKISSMSESELHERLAYLFKQTSLGIAVEDLMRELVPADNPWWTGKGIPIETESTLAPPTLPQPARANSRLSNFPATVREWLRLTTELFEVGTATLGGGRMARASTASNRNHAPAAAKPANILTWRQDNLPFELSCAGAPPFTVTLHTDADLDAKVIRLCLVNKDSLIDNAEAAPQEESFSVEQIDTNTYTVDMPPAAFAARVRAIVWARKQADAGGTDPRHLLPFVVMSE